MRFAKDVLLPVGLAVALAGGIEFTAGSVGVGLLAPAMANESDSDSESGGKKEKTRIEKVTQRQLTRMYPEELEKFANRKFNWRMEYDPVVVIEGFSESMSGWILRGASVKPRVFRRLLKRLEGVTDEKKRLEILNEEKRRLQSEVDARRRGIERLEERLKNEKDDNTARELRRALADEQAGQRDAGHALETVNTWIAHPNEGLGN